MTSGFWPKENYLRKRADGSHAKVEFVELFFDLIFVFAITQLSHGLLHHLTPAGAAETAFLLLAVWWVWMYTTWVTNWLDPARIPVRLMLFALMAAGLVMSSALPKAFGAGAMTFAVAYTSMQVGRTLFMVWSTKAHSPLRATNFIRIAAWLALAGVFWIAGALAGHEMQIVLWVIALAIEFAGPVARFWTPGLGASEVGTWDVDPHHMAERCGLFIIIALGESILVTGATFAGLTGTAPEIAAFAAALVGALAMWWIYFAIGQDYALKQFSSAQEVGRVARLAYTYLHIPIVAGIIVVAAGDELALAHPLGHSQWPVILCVVGGAALYLAGVSLFKMAFFGRPPLSHMAGLVMLGGLAFAAAFLQPLAVTIITSLILVIVAIWEHNSLKSVRAEAAHGHH